MDKALKWLATFFFFSVVILHADTENLGGDINLEEMKGETLFVSLGCLCRPAAILRECGLRKVAFPFDWNITVDNEKFAELIEDDFLYFLDENFLLTHPNGSALINTYYHIEFVHDGDWLLHQKEASFLNFFSKYGRRIDRFRKLADYLGKVFFIRGAYINIMKDENRFFQFPDCIEISECDAMMLSNALKKRFPALDFQLIIMNYHSNENIEEQKKIDDSIIMIRAPIEKDGIFNKEPYVIFFNKLLTSETK